MNHKKTLLLPVAALSAALFLSACSDEGGSDKPTENEPTSTPTPSDTTASASPSESSSEGKDETPPLGEIQEPTLSEGADPADPLNWDVETRMDILWGELNTFIADNPKAKDWEIMDFEIHKLKKYKIPVDKWEWYTGRVVPE